MSQDIYQQGIKALAATDTTAERLEDKDSSVTLDNPLCGDRLTLDIKLENHRIVDVGYLVKGCLLCRAAAGAIGQAAINCNQTDISAVSEQLETMLQGQPPASWPEPWQCLSLFQPVQSHKSRHSCVLLPFQALTKALYIADGEPSETS